MNDNIPMKKALKYRPYSTQGYFKNFKLAKGKRVNKIGKTAQCEALTVEMGNPALSKKILKVLIPNV